MTAQPSRLAQPPRLPVARVIASLCVTASLLGAGAVTAAPDAGAAPVAPDTHAGTELVLRALSLLGVNYRLGGNSPDTGLDCSGLVRHVFREAVGLVLPRRAEEMSRAGQQIDVSQLKPGDLVFFNTLRRTFSHVGIYIGNSQFVHAPSSGGAVRVESLSQGYWVNRFNGARRLLTGSDTSQPPLVTASFLPSLPAAHAAGVPTAPTPQALPLSGAPLARTPQAMPLGGF
jgi:cell wall-associated NlpC family hydrolase